MNPEGISHVVRVVVEDHDLHGRSKLSQPTYEEVGDMVEVAAAREHERRRFAERLEDRDLQRVELASRAAEANRLLPFTQRDRCSTRQRPHRAVEIKNQRARHGASHDPLRKTA